MNIFDIINLILHQYAYIPMMFFALIIGLLGLKIRSLRRLLEEQKQKSEKKWKDRLDKSSQNTQTRVEQRAEEIKGRWQKKYNKQSRLVGELREQIQKKEQLIQKQHTQIKQLQKNVINRGENNLNC
ncbi:MAG: hypothetical protein MI784_07870 [Cytophagales bacterium]|nr:hypothetical protein [Cytophagales bacterium]